MRGVAAQDAQRRPARWHGSLTEDIDTASDAPAISVVIPTQGRPDRLARTLEALERQRLREGNGFEVVVVVDETTERPQETLAAVAARGLDARTLEAPAIGVSAKRNHGFRNARSKTILFLGDDILADRSLVAEHIDWHRHNPAEELGVLGHVRWARELKITAFMRWLDHGPQFDYPSIDKPDLGWGRFWTANLSLKRAMLERVGGFDETYTFAYEDLEVGMRLYEAGFQLRYDPRARAEHLHPTDLESWKRRMATVAVAERRFCSEHPEVAPYFYNMFALAQRRPPSRGRLAGLARWIPKRMPLLGPKVWNGADWYFPQQLAPAFMASWNSAQVEDEGSREGSKPGGS